jgi:hypothetical protein
MLPAGIQNLSTDWIPPKLVPEGLRRGACGDDGLLALIQRARGNDDLVVRTDVFFMPGAFSLVVVPGGRVLKARRSCRVSSDSNAYKVVDLHARSSVVRSQFASTRKFFHCRSSVSIFHKSINLLHTKGHPCLTFEFVAHGFDFLPKGGDRSTELKEGFLSVLTLTRD